MSKTKRALYKSLTKTLGDPKTMTVQRRTVLLNLLGGWIGQHPDDQVRRRLRRDTNIAYPPRYNAPVPRVNIYEKHAHAARVDATPKWHWKIQRLVQLPKQNAINVRLGIPALPGYGMAPAGMPWDWMHKGTGKELQIIIPVNYHLTVHKHGVCVVDRKIVQRIWNHRVYSDKEVWECSYWDFSKLGRDEHTWVNAKWREGFVVKMAVGSAVEPTLSRALSMAQSRVVRAGITSILSDTDD